MSERTCPTCHKQLPSYLFQAELNCMLCRNLNGTTYQLESAKPQPINRREAALIRRYGITFKDYEAIYKRQKRCCKVCGTRRPLVWGEKLPFVVDHDHKTGKVRGLLCDQCNTALGLLKDNRGSLERAQAYLKKHE